MFRYICFWKGKRCEVRALRSFDAQELAAELFRKSTKQKVKTYDITVMLAEKEDGSPHVHSTGML